MHTSEERLKFGIYASFLLLRRQGACLRGGWQGDASGQGAGMASLAALRGSYLARKWAHGGCPQLFTPLERAGVGGGRAGEGIAARRGQERRRSLERERGNGLEDGWMW